MQRVWLDRPVTKEEIAASWAHAAAIVAREQQSTTEAVIARYTRERCQQILNDHQLKDREALRFVHREIKQHGLN